MENNEIFKIKPKFNLIYELTMPVGRKLKRSLFIVIILVVIMTILKCNEGKIETLEIFENFQAVTLLLWICVFFAIIFTLKFIIDLILKVMQYNRIVYKFNEENIIYEDNFLNQQKKVIKYENVKEVEIRRSVLDRILGYGIIIISTNAEGNIASGLVIYGIKDSNNVYEKINDLVQRKSGVTNQNLNVKIDSEEKSKQNEIEKEKITQEEKTSVSEIQPSIKHDEDFTESLKNINK